MNNALKPLKILLTGAKGFTGLHLNRLAQNWGYEVVPLLANLNEQVELEKEVLAAKPDFVVHLAGISFVASTDQEAFYRVHALGTSNLLKAISKLPQKPIKVLLASSATVYGNSPLSPSTENQPLSPIDHYAISKVAMEEIAKTYFDLIPIVIARPFNYTGVGQKGNFLIPKLIDHFSRQSQFIELGNLNIEREFNDVGMICEAYLHLLKLGVASEIYNVCTGQARSLKMVLDALTQLTSHPIDIRVNPDFVRSNEVHRMCGNPAKLLSLLAAHNLELPPSILTKTLAEMLAFAKTSSNQKISSL